MALSEAKQAGIVCFIIVFIISIILFAVSFSTIELQEWGIVYDNNKKEVEYNPHDSGRYLVGLGRKFIKYPRGLILVEYSSEDSAQTDHLSCWTQDGVNVYLEISYYVRLNQTLLHEFYYEFGTKWYASIVRITIAAIKDQTVKYLTVDYFDKRQTIGDETFNAVQAKFDELTLKAVQLVSFQLRKISFETDFEQSITDKLIQLQAKRTYLILMDTAKILKNTEFLEQQAENNITLINAQAEANGTNYTMNAEAVKMATLIKMDADVYYNISTNLSLYNEELLQFMYVSELQQINQTKIIIDPSNVIISM